MTHEKKVYVADLTEGQVVEDLFLVKSVSRAETRAGKGYLIMTLMDKSGEIGGRLWENADRLLVECPAGSLVLLHGQAQSYKNIMQLKIDTLRAVAAELQGSGLDTALFLPAAATDIDTMAAELVGLAKSVADEKLRRLLARFFAPGDFFSAFQEAPAAKSMHHAYCGGLLEHTLAVSRLAAELSAFYDTLDRSLLVSGALLHDIGKVEEFDFSRYPYDYSDRGRLVGHLVIGAEMVQTQAAAIDGFPPELSNRLQHLILSHHGRYEYGSPSLPMMAEAFVLNFIDDLDAKMNYLGRLAGQAQAEGYQWTDYQRTLERFLFVKGRPRQEATPAIPAEQGGEQDGLPATTNDPLEPRTEKQQSLF